MNCDPGILYVHGGQSRIGIRRDRTSVLLPRPMHVEKLHEACGTPSADQHIWVRIVLCVKEILRNIPQRRHV